MSTSAQLDRRVTAVERDIAEIKRDLVAIKSDVAELQTWVLRNYDLIIDGFNRIERILLDRLPPRGSAE